MKSELEIAMERFVLIFRLFQFFVDIQLHDFLAMKKRVLYFMYLILYSKNNDLLLIFCTFQHIITSLTKYTKSQLAVNTGFLMTTEFFC